MNLLPFVLFMLSAAAAWGQVTPTVTVVVDFVPENSDALFDISIDTSIDVNDDFSPLPRSFSIRSFRTQGQSSRLQLPDRLTFESGSHKLLVFGKIDYSDNETRFIPIQIFDRREIGKPDLIEIDSLRTTATRNEAFRASYPFAQIDRGALDSSSVNSVLAALKYAIESGFVGSSQDNWDRMGSFLEANAIFVRTGSEPEVSKVITYLDQYDRISGDDAFPLPYARFLINTVKNKYDRTKFFGDASLDAHVHSTLQRLFREQLKFTFSRADVAMEAYMERDEFARCMNLATEVYYGVTEAFISGMQQGGARQLNAISSLGQGALCASLLYRKEVPESRNAIAPVGDHLAKSSDGIAFMRSYVSVVRKLDAENKIDRTSPARPREVWQWFDEYEQALQDIPS